VLTVVTDDAELTNGDVGNRGFCLTYQQIPCMWAPGPGPWRGTHTWKVSSCDHSIKNVTELTVVTTDTESPWYSVAVFSFPSDSSSAPVVFNLGYAKTSEGVHENILWGYVKLRRQILVNTLFYVLDVDYKLYKSERWREMTSVATWTNKVEYHWASHKHCLHCMSSYLWLCGQTRLNTTGLATSTACTVCHPTCGYLDKQGWIPLG
jgi:hypothetical protein